MGQTPEMAPSDLPEQPAAVAAHGAAPRNCTARLRSTCASQPVVETAIELHLGMYINKYMYVIIYTCHRSGISMVYLWLIFVLVYFPTIDSSGIYGCILAYLSTYVYIYNYIMY